MPRMAETRWRGGQPGMTRPQGREGPGPGTQHLQVPMSSAGDESHEDGAHGDRHAWGRPTERLEGAGEEPRTHELGQET